MADQRSMLRRIGPIFAARSLIRIRLASAKDHHRAPLRREHARRALRKSLQKSRQVARLRRIHRKLHQFFGLIA